MRRWHSRVSGRLFGDEHFIDDCYAFFTCCFHLKDWLKADAAVDESVRGKVEQYVAGNLWLGLCADLANGSKHMVLDRPRFDEPARMRTVGDDALVALVYIGNKPYSPQRV